MDSSGGIISFVCAAVPFESNGLFSSLLRVSTQKIALEKAWLASTRLVDERTKKSFPIARLATTQAELRSNASNCARDRNSCMRTEKARKDTPRAVGRRGNLFTENEQRIMEQNALGINSNMRKSFSFRRLPLVARLQSPARINEIFVHFLFVLALSLSVVSAPLAFSSKNHLKLSLQKSFSLLHLCLSFLGHAMAGASSSSVSRIFQFRFS